MMLSGGVEDKNPKAAGWLEKMHINLDADILVARDIGERRVLTWHHNFEDLMLGASCGFNISDILLSGETLKRLKV